ncbi:MAG TPA: BatA and WFA domain-containing protein, partial [Bacillaceae bacterium]
MGILNPAFFSLSVLIGAVILFYMFRKRYDPVTISTNMLWEQVMNEWQASPWIDRLQRNFLLLLQLLTLLLLMLALVRPYWTVKGIAADHVILLLDVSASMSARYDAENTRFDKSVSDMKKLADKLDGQEVTIIAAGSKPEILLDRESDKGKIRTAISQIQLKYEHENMQKAVMLAEMLAEKNG